MCPMRITLRVGMRNTHRTSSPSWRLVKIVTQTSFPTQFVSSDIINGKIQFSSHKTDVMRFTKAPKLILTKIDRKREENKIEKLFAIQKNSHNKFDCTIPLHLERKPLYQF